MGQRRTGLARDRAIGAQLYTFRLEHAKLSLEDAAAVIGWSPATLSRTENGKRHITSEDVASVLTAYKVPVKQRSKLIEEARAVSQAGWWARPLPGVLPDLSTLASYESKARAVTNWSATVIPGLLQTEGYAKAFMRADGIRPQDIKARWAARQKRQQVLPKIEYTAFIFEGVLHAPFGGATALKEQLGHLLDASTRGRGIRIVREVHAALIHSWMLLEFPQDSPIVHVELLRSGVFLHDEEVEPYTATRDKLSKVALSVAESRSMIRALMERL